MKAFLSHVAQNCSQRITSFEPMAAPEQNGLRQKLSKDIQTFLIDVLLPLTTVLVHALIGRRPRDFHSKNLHQRMIQDRIQLQEVASDDLTQDITQCFHELRVNVTTARNRATTATD